MTFSVIVATSNLQLSTAVSNRLLHPAIGFELIATVSDVVELMALTNSIAPDLVIIDQELPDLTKVMVKQLIRTFHVLVLSETSNRSIFSTKYSANQIDLSGLAKALGAYRKIAREQENLRQGSELIAVAAVASASGASSVAVNLALSLSRYHDALLMDFDFTHPSLLAQLNIQTTRGLRQLALVLPQTNLTPVELAQYCVKVNESLQFLPGLSAAYQANDLDLSHLDEIVEAAMDFNKVVIMDLGQLLTEGSISKAQSELIALSQRLIIVVSADPISVLTSCNWLSSIGSKYSHKLETVINKVKQPGDRPELAKLIKETTGVLPTAYLPLETKNFAASVWTGKPVTVAKPKSSFSRAIHNWVATNSVPDISEKDRTEPRLHRLREVS